MRLDEIVLEDQQEIMAFNNAWNIWIQGQGKAYNGAEQTAIKRMAQQEANRGIDPMDAISAAAGTVRSQRKQPKVSEPKPAPGPQKTAPEPEVTRSRGAQIGNQNARKNWEPTSAIGKKIQKGQQLSKKLGGIGGGAQRRNRKLNPFN